MQLQTIGAQRGYNIARTALAPENLAQSKTQSASSPVAQGIRAFEQVFENVQADVEGYAAGKTNAQTVVESMAQAELALEAAVTIRNRVVEAYQEILRMPI